MGSSEKLISNLAMGAFILGLTVFFSLAGPEAVFAHKKVRKTKHTRFTEQELEPLLGSLERMGFEREEIYKVFYDQRLRKLDRVISINAISPDSPEIYAQFTSPFAIRLARRFMRRHWRELHRVDLEYGVPKQFITAILLVETQFGKARLPYRVLEVFTSLAVESRPDSVQRHYERLKPRHPEIEKEWLASRLMNKAEFAMRELVAVLSMFKQNLQHLYEVRGSYAGAIGIPQFLPSSYLQWAVDGNGDGRVDLNNLSDAMPSVGNFLRYHGWKPQAPFKEKWKAIWEYNHSTNYVRTIYEVAFRLYWQPKPRK